MKPLIEQITDQIKFEYDNGVLKAVQNVGFNVDKERLTKALMDSRSFYNEGYEDAKEKYEKNGYHAVKDCQRMIQKCLLVMYMGIYTCCVLKVIWNIAKIIG